ncbi:uncharacterized protein Z518_10711 [Rhinocladiella mackenziei CBS 650.93]|uniref:MaoC-like domain-containing protein n=1 Tax=Rhinocladiella mackenziei CBS 650.93 TaxID=1442369 RepID=A0A0D2I211_9EURO|nr:uncharacterized protein Z518_10711 [Rhinocladiella mackenziei CBS 650.93]KIW99783.1 hypothetical protein Z518_10711 [Rhinocladiella mackenziei CBS 650.93]
MRRREPEIDYGVLDKKDVIALRVALQNHLELKPIGSLLPPGYQQVTVNHWVKESRLCNDGADRLHAPNDDWKYRVWVGGRIFFRQQRIHLDRRLPVRASENIINARLAGDLTSEDAKVFVTLRKALSFEFDSKTLLELKLGENRLPSRLQSQLVLEEKQLCFMRNIPPSLRSMDNPRKIPPALDPDYSQSMIPSQTLLFRFSALTRNDHAIHLDPEYTKRVYGIPKLLVHGPLTSVLMLDILRECLLDRGTKTPYAFVIREFEYRNHLPLFAGEQISIACKKLRNIYAGEGAKFRTDLPVPWELWEVWIQKGEGDNATVAVRGRARVQPATVSRLGPEEYDDADEESAFPLPTEQEETVQSRHDGVDSILQVRPYNKNPKAEPNNEDYPKPVSRPVQQSSWFSREHQLNVRRRPDFQKGYYLYHLPLPPSDQSK